jgi:hypothetical protein
LHFPFALPFALALAFSTSNSKPSFHFWCDKQKLDRPTYLRSHHLLCSSPMCKQLFESSLLSK